MNKWDWFILFSSAFFVGNIIVILIVLENLSIENFMLNILPEVLGIFLTVGILERFRLNREEQKNKKLKEHLYKRISRVLYSFFNSIFVNTMHLMKAIEVNDNTKPEEILKKSIESEFEELDRISKLENKEIREVINKDYLFKLKGEYFGELQEQLSALLDRYSDFLKSDEIKVLDELEETCYRLKIILSNIEDSLTRDPRTDFYKDFALVRIIEMAKMFNEIKKIGLFDPIKTGLEYI